MTTGYLLSLALRKTRGLYAPLLWPESQPRSSYVGFMVDETVLVLVFYQYFSFSCQSFNLFLHTHQHLSIRKLVADVSSGLSHTPHKINQENSVFGDISLYDAVTIAKC
jgi:hypothetical protein